MYIKCWGSRGSIAVCGKEYLKYGGDTTCIEVRSKNNDLVIIDAGTGIRSLGNKLVTEQNMPITMLITHAHWDHLMGFPFFKPLFNEESDICIYYSSERVPSSRTLFEGLMNRPYFPVQLDDLDVRAHLMFKNIPQEPLHLGSMIIRPITLSHPKDSGFGFRFEEEGKSFVFLTDNELGYIHKGGCTFQEYERFCLGVDLLIHDAEYEVEEYETILKKSHEPWGHSVVTDVVRLACKAHVKNLGLFHHNAQRTDTKLDKMVERANKLISETGEPITCFAVSCTYEITL